MELSKTFPERMKNEAFVDQVEDVLTSIREYLISGVNDSLHDAEYETAAQDATQLAAVLNLEVFVLAETPQF